MRLTNTAEANAALEELISQKLRKGYVVAKRPAAPKPRRRTKGDGTLIARLEAWLLANRPTYLKQLKKGADAKDIEKLERAVGATVPAAFKAFLAWRNGQSGSCWSALGAVSLGGKPRGLRFPGRLPCPGDCLAHQTCRPPPGRGRRAA